MEHASVAAFARFVLQLMSMGAPADLVDAASSAMRDETEHARLCFGLASRYAGQSIGPGALPSDDALGGSSFEEIVRTAFLEACIGETCAALEAAEAAMHVEDPAVATALRRIAHDETRHAELGWKFIRWVLGTMNPGQRAALGRDLERIVGEHIDETRRSAEDAPLSPHERQLLEHGVAPAALRRAVRLDGLVEIVFPCLRALLTAQSVAANAAEVVSRRTGAATPA
jgi:hypothetical protein